MNRTGLPFTDHYTEEPVPLLNFLGHSFNMETGQHTLEYAFSDGQVLCDKLPPNCTRQNLANHLQFAVDQMRAMDQIIEPPEGEDG